MFCGWLVMHDACCWCEWAAVLACLVLCCLFHMLVVHVMCMHFVEHMVGVRFRGWYVWLRSVWVFCMVCRAFGALGWKPRWLLLLFFFFLS